LLADDEGRLAGMVTRGDLMRAQGETDANHLTVLEAGTSELVVAYPDETLRDAVDKMLRHDIGRLPVIARDTPGKIVGYLGRADILAARMRHHQEEELREKGPLISGA
jgi:CBS domain-containing protein